MKNSNLAVYSNLRFLFLYVISGKVKFSDDETKHDSCNGRVLALKNVYTH
mgnify:CR=1 FL=1